MTLPLADAGRVASWLCELTDELLFAPRAAGLERAVPGLRYRSRVGSGRQTCLRHYSDGRLTITYGRRMVQDKFDPEHTLSWTTSREIRGRGYFGGSLAPVHTLAHTALHEFAHLLQVADAERRRGSVHNAAFYARLDALHSAGDAARLAAALEARAGAAGIDFSPRAPAVEERARRIAREREFAALAVGDRVRVHGRDRDYTGTVRRINRHSVSCDLDDGNRLRFTVHAAFERL